MLWTNYLILSLKHNIQPSSKVTQHKFTILCLCKTCFPYNPPTENKIYILSVAPITLVKSVQKVCWQILLYKHNISIYGKEYGHIIHSPETPRKCLNLGKFSYLIINKQMYLFQIHSQAGDHYQRYS